MVVEKIIMPQLGESVTEGSISKWLVNIGDHVKKYDPICEIMSDKVNAEVPSSFTGVIKEIIAYEGDTLAVGEVICTMETTDSKDTRPLSINNKDNDHTPIGKHSDKTEKARYSPAVLKLSQEYGIDLQQLKGTGAGGRITRKDVIKFLESQDAMAEKKEAVTPAQESQVNPREMKPEPIEKTDMKIPIAEGDTFIPVTGVRKAIADHMIKSKHEIPHAWMMIEVDVTNLVAYRNSIKDAFKKREGYNITFFAFFVKAVAQALAEFPMMNAMWAGDKIIRKKHVHLSIAVATEDELFTPVIRNADEKTIKGIAREIDELAKKVRSGNLTREDLQGGTFTVNNTGTIGSVQSMGIINHPQAAILQIESIVKRPIVMNQNMIAVRDMVNLCLSLDHRVLDGFICGKFMNRVKDILEKTSKETTPIY